MDRKFFKPVPRFQHRDEDLSRIIYDFIALPVIFPKKVFMEPGRFIQYSNR